MEAAAGLQHLAMAWSSCLWSQTPAFACSAPSLSANSYAQLNREETLEAFNLLIAFSVPAQEKPRGCEPKASNMSEGLWGRARWQSGTPPASGLFCHVLC